jgi:hypothetical protein
MIIIYNAEVSMIIIYNAEVCMIIICEIQWNLS